MSVIISLFTLSKLTYMAVTDKAIKKIKEMITLGELKPGDRLPPEKELSAYLGISRNSMREAIKALVTLRVLDVKQGDGTYVTSLEPNLLLEVLGFVSELNNDRLILDIFQVRRILEPAATFLACSKITEQELLYLREILAEVSNTSSIEELIEHDVKFHQTIVSASGNKYLSTLIESLSSQTIKARIWRGLTQHNSVQQTLNEHNQILKALEQKDAGLAEAMALCHISGVESWIKEAGRI